MCKCARTHAQTSVCVCVCVSQEREVRTEQEERDDTVFRGPIADINLRLLYGDVLR